MTTRAHTGELKNPLENLWVTLRMVCLDLFIQFMDQHGLFDVLNSFPFSKLEFLGGTF